MYNPIRILLEQFHTSFWENLSLPFFTLLHFLRGVGGRGDVFSPQLKDEFWERGKRVIHADLRLNRRKEGKMPIRALVPH